ncbi:alpha/beta fold hydrolase [Sinomonas sp. G460-2]|uniref:alpha/beta fold hydrolase n=1 Tax=Sinomonas sp. G460-2 TaxID=3393464 RepID=UPI0039EFFBC9
MTNDPNHSHAGGLSVLAERRDSWRRAAEEDAQLREFRRNADLRIAFTDGNERVTVRVTPGGLDETENADVTLVAPAVAWNELLSGTPAPTMNHFLAMLMRVNGTRIEGDEIRFGQHAHVVRRLLELARESVDRPIDRAPDPVLDRSGIRGRHVPVTVDGDRVDLYVEEAGTGSSTPLLVLHTAGADGRQAHPLMADAELTARRRVIAFDMPGHGRSDALPGPLGSWSLTPDRYADAILGVIDALGLERPILVGASMAGEACLLMAYRAPDRLGGVIACEASEYVPGRVTPWAGHPQVNESIFVPEWIDGLIAPTAPASMRDLIWRGYSQGGHRTFAGDIDFYSGGWDGRGIVNLIDTSICPVVMMTGEFDYSCTPAMSQATAEQIPGARFWMMPGLGHFPICEHPAAFRPHLDKALAEIGA